VRPLLFSLVLLLISAPADAGKKRHKRPHKHPRSPRVMVSAPNPAVTVGLGPWSVAFVPTGHRSGYTWVGGRVVRGRVVPGYWRPAVTRTGHVYVQGYWIDDAYVDGFWREDERDGLIWLDGYYDEDGQWVEGVWVPEDNAEVDVLYVQDLSTEEGEAAETIQVEVEETDIWLQSGEGEIHAEPPGF